MGWGGGSSSSSGEEGNSPRCSTRRVITSRCRTEEVDGRLIRKCEKTEKLLRECVGRPAEVVESTTEHTLDDVTDRPGWALDGGGNSGGRGVDFFDFPGLRSDVAGMQRSLEDGLRSFVNMAEEMTDNLFRAPSHRRRDSPPPPPPPPPPEKDARYGDDFPGQLTDV
ncbi:mal d 1-associated protein [Wolffia australiana]